MHYQPVWQFGTGVVAVFFDYSSAVSFINSEAGSRTLYLGIPMEKPNA